MHCSVIELREVFKSKYFRPDTEISGVSTDTRTLVPGNLYVALRGEVYDGHNFVKEAAEKGAAAVLVDHRIDDVDVPQIIVPDTLAGLGYLASRWRASFPIPVIAVTGSSGKTTVKNMIASILLADSNGDTSKVLATEGNFNNEIGLPLNLLRLEVGHDVAVLEMGMNQFGEISRLTRMAHPNVAVITNAFPCHLEGVGDVAGVAKAKGEIFEGLVRHGFAVLNRDDEYFSFWKNLLGDKRCVSFGFHEDADVSAMNISSEVQQQTFTLTTPEGHVDVILPLPGEHNIRNALAAATACLAIGIDLNSIQQGLAQAFSEGSRMQTHVLESGATIIDDAYNANPMSTRAAIDYLATLPGKKIMAFADMRELGPDAVKYHTELGEYMREKGVDLLLAYGDLASHTVKAFGKHGVHFENKEALTSALEQYTHDSHNVILVKGSNSMGLQAMVKTILNNHSKVKA